MATEVNGALRNVENSLSHPQNVSAQGTETPRRGLVAARVIGGVGARSTYPFRNPIAEQMIFAVLADGGLSI